MRVTGVVLALALLACAVAPTARAQSRPDSVAHADTAAAAPETTRVSPEPAFGAPPSGTPPPLKTRTQRGGPYNVVADRLEGGRSATDGEVIMLIGNVTLSRAGTVVKAQNGRYVKREGTIYLTGGVHAVDGTTTITALEAAYNETTDFLTLTNQVVVHDKDLVLTGDFGSYDQATGRAELWSRVKGKEKGRTLTTDRVVYLRDEQLAQARGRVTARDSTEGVTLTADAMDYDRAHEISRATIHPVLIQDARGGKGATTLTGDTITVESKTRTARAAGNVHVQRDSLNATAGQAVFYDQDQRGVLTDHPQAATEDVTVRGDTLEVFTKDRGLERLRVRQAGVIDYRARGTDTEGQVSKLTADRMEIFFTGDAVDSLVAQENAANEFTGAPVPGKASETNRTEGTLMRLYFANKELDRAVVTGGAKGVYHAERDVADSTAAKEAVAYQAGRITFEVPRNRIRLEQDATLDYEDLSLKAPEVVFDLKAQVLEAKGNPMLADRGDTLRGKALAYDLQERKGAIFGARTRYESGWYSGDRIRRLGDSVVDVRGARYTTCSHDPPHYSFTSNRMKIYLKDKIIARPIVFSVKSLPLLALPFYVFPIRDDRHSGLLVPSIQFGFSTDAGGFIRNAGYFWAPNEYMDITVAGDYYPTRPAWLLSGQARYRLLYKFEGEMVGSYSRTFDDGGKASDFRARHLQQIDENTSLTAEANFTSSGDFTRDPLTGKPLADRIDRFLISNLTLNHRRPWASFNLFLARREDLDADPVTSPLPKLTEQLPQLTIAFPTRTLGRREGRGKDAFLPFLSTTYYSFNARFLNQRQVNVFLAPDSLGNLVDADTTIANTVYQHQLTLSDNRRAFGFVNLGPTFRYNQVVYDEDVLGKSPAAGATWGVGGSAAMTLYGSSKGGIGPVTGFRHTFTPAVSYSYQPDFPGLKAKIPLTDSTSVTVDRFPSVAGFGLPASQASFLSFNISNRFETKVKHGGKEKTLTNLLSVNFASAYDFLYKRGLRTTPWQPIATTIRVQPPGYVSGDLNLTSDPMFAKTLRNANASLGVRFSGGGAARPVADIPLGGNEAQTRGPGDPLVPWNLSASFSYGGGRTGDGPWSHRESANLVMQIRPTRNWQLNYYNQLDLTERRIVAQEYTVTRNLDCWNMQFVRRFSGGTADYYFKIGIVDRPEIFIDRGTTGIGGYGGLGNLPGIGGIVPQ